MEETAHRSVLSEDFMQHRLKIPEILFGFSLKDRTKITWHKLSAKAP